MKPYQKNPINGFNSLTTTWLPPSKTAFPMIHAHAKVSSSGIYWLQCITHVASTVPHHRPRPNDDSNARSHHGRPSSQHRPTGGYGKGADLDGTELDMRESHSFFFSRCVSSIKSSSVIYKSSCPSKSDLWHRNAITFTCPQYGQESTFFSVWEPQHSKIDRVRCRGKHS